MLIEKNKVGRPKKNEEDKVKYQRIAISLQSYAKLKDMSMHSDTAMVDILDEILLDAILLK